MAPLKKWVFLSIILTSLQLASAQYLEINSDNVTVGICRSVVSYSLSMLKNLKGCVVVVGNVKLALMEYQKNFDGISFPELREITGYLMLYRVNGLKSLGQLFPNLARIRGSELFMNYALIVFDMSSLQEIGLFNLLKIDRGSVIIYAKPTTCFLDTINWNTIAPRVRHVINRDTADGRIGGVDCTTTCTCTQDYTTNHCWNNRKCQRFLEGPEGETCHDECFGCRKTRANSCTLCRHYTYEKRCLKSCPNNTYSLEPSKYCLTLEQCHKLKGWLFNNTCTLACPYDYKMVNNSDVLTCEPCEHCAQTCGKLIISSLDAMQAAQGCVFVNGSLTINVSAVTEAMEELRLYLGHIKQVRDYILVHSSLTITSLDFLSSLDHIQGKNLLKDSYSVMVFEMTNLQTLFADKVVKNLKIDAGTISMYSNPLLCKTEINKIINLFPVKPSELDIPAGMNGYSGSCKLIEVDLSVKNIEENTALVTFSRDIGHEVSYSVLYMRLLPGDNTEIVPETCSDVEWYAVSVESSTQKKVEVILNDLKDTSNYVICIESYDSVDAHFTRSPTVKFSTKIGRPEPSFLTEVVAASANSIVIHWVNHLRYSSHITHYELDVVIAHDSDDDVDARNHCEDFVSKEDLNDHYEFSPHAVVIRPPDHYERACETMCGILSRGISGAMVQEDFDPCEFDIDCEDIQEPDIPNNVTFSEFDYYRSISLRVNGSKNSFQIGGLAPYRDYRVRLRACINSTCSRSSRRVVRTKALRDADLATVVSANAFDGNVIVNWEAPKVPNGPVLSYNLQVKPRIRYIESGVLMPIDTCLSNKYRSTSIITEVADMYLVRICTTTLAPDKTCTEWTKVISKNTIEWQPTLWWQAGAGISGAIVICLISYFGQKYCRYFKLTVDDNIPLVRRRLSVDSESISDSTFNLNLLQTSHKTPSRNPFQNLIQSHPRTRKDLELNVFKVLSSGDPDQGPSTSHNLRTTGVNISPIYSESSTRYESSSNYGPILKDHESPLIVFEREMDDVSLSSTASGSSPNTSRE